MSIKCDVLLLSNSGCNRCKLELYISSLVLYCWLCSPKAKNGPRYRRLSAIDRRRRRDQHNLPSLGPRYRRLSAIDRRRRRDQHNLPSPGPRCRRLSAIDRRRRRDQHNLPSPSALHMSSDCRHYFDCATYSHCDSCVSCCIWHHKQLCEVQLCERYLFVILECKLMYWTCRHLSF